MPGRLRAQRLFISVLSFARRPELLAFLPALTLAAFWVGGEAALLITALTVPLVYALGGILGVGSDRPLALPGVDPLTELPLRDAVVARLDRNGALAGEAGPACIALVLDEADAIARQQGHEGYCAILRQTAARLAGAAGRDDVVARLDGGCFAVALAPGQPADLEAVLQLAGRLQEAVEVAISLDGLTVHVTASLGFCLAGRAPAPGGATLLEAALMAMDDARLNGPGAIRAYTAEMCRVGTDMAELRRDLGPALDSGEVRAHFQPQISTDTGAISGFETLVRWHHPERGLLAPSEFLPGILAAGLSERLGEVMLTGALRALRSWDRDGRQVPTVTVNFAPEELRNPRLPEKIQWEIDRFGLTPERLTIDIREAVVAHATDEVLMQTLARAAAMGCRIDLDAFGVGQASVAAIRRFSVHRLKIDRSFVAGIHRDRAQQRTVAAIVSLAEQLGLDTLAVGVETQAEHAMLAQLGCGHVQGYGIARPMPEEVATEWLRTRAAAADPIFPLGKRTG